MEDELILASTLREVEDGFIHLQLTPCTTGSTLASSTDEFIIDPEGDVYLHCVKTFNPRIPAVEPDRDGPFDLLLVSSHFLRMVSPAFADILSKTEQSSDGKKHVFVPFTALSIEPLLLKLHYRAPYLTLQQPNKPLRLTPAMLEEILLFISLYEMHTVSLRISQCVYHHLATTWTESKIATVCPLIANQQFEVLDILRRLSKDTTLCTEVAEWVSIAAGMWQSNVLNEVAKVLVLAGKETKEKEESVWVCGDRAIASRVPIKISEAITSRRSILLRHLSFIIRKWIKELECLPSVDSDGTRPHLANLYEISSAYDESTLSIVEFHNIVCTVGNLHLTKEQGACQVCARVAFEIREALLLFINNEWDVAPWFKKRNPRMHYNPSFV